MTVRVNNIPSFKHDETSYVKIMCRIMIDFEEHISVLRLGIRNQQAIKFLSKGLRCESAAENQTGEQFSKQDKIRLPQQTKFLCNHR